MKKMLESTIKLKKQKLKRKMKWLLEEKKEDNLKLRWIISPIYTGIRKTMKKRYKPKKINNFNNSGSSIIKNCKNKKMKKQLSKDNVVEIYKNIIKCKLDKNKKKLNKCFYKK